ncbi:SseB family protein [Arthrobacter sp. zg-Y820]|uniref:SseB family protein n=1 Tax=unclassified Arthrobacter TaxID=235627 RepID=UPI001E4B406D|nr:MULTISPECIES: SseB family protein [unclassified Arthrobacter]MCC9197034.1 SseB family protein [Arthrobacter sp. zg-Y820]MDK1279899.1 SseB family protein [Arthrobacter sp. zg.Y820]WIB09201.1 SseB family protein [Arthrobacter sp. zg-Y820]
MAENTDNTDGAGQDTSVPGQAQYSDPEGAAALEEAIVAGKEGRISSQELVARICESELLSVGRLQDDQDPSSFQALVLKSPEGDSAVAATFTTAGRVPEQIREQAPVMVKAGGEATLRSIAQGYGLAINPGSDMGLELGPEGVAAIVAAYDQAAANRAPDSAPDGAEGNPQAQ